MLLCQVEQGVAELGLLYSSPCLAHPQAFLHPPAVLDSLTAAGLADGAVHDSSCARRLCQAVSISPGVVGAEEDGVPGHRGLLSPCTRSTDAAANIPSWLFIFRIPWQGQDGKQLIFSWGHLHPMTAAFPPQGCGVHRAPWDPTHLGPEPSSFLRGCGRPPQVPELSPMLSSGPCLLRRRCAASSWRRAQGQWRMILMLS